MFYDQTQSDLRCEWGRRGVEVLAPISDVVIIVDVLSFSTCVEIATAKGAVVFPYRWGDMTCAAFAEFNGAVLAGSRSVPGAFSLSPSSLQRLTPGAKLVLPSPNGSTLSFSTSQTATLCGCLRNCRAVASFASSLGRRIAVIPAGERWEDGSLRPAVEDWIGAGAILRCLPGTRSPEARAAIAAFETAAPNMAGFLKSCASGRELVERGFEADVLLASDLNLSQAIPLLKDGAYVNQVLTA